MLRTSFQCPIGSWPADPKLKTLGRFAKGVLDSDAEGTSPSYFSAYYTVMVGLSNVKNRLRPLHVERRHGVDSGGNSSLSCPSPPTAAGQEHPCLVSTTSCIRSQARAGRCACVRAKLAISSYQVQVGMRYEPCRFMLLFRHSWYPEKSFMPLRFNGSEGLEYDVALNRAYNLGGKVRLS